MSRNESNKSIESNNINDQKIDLRLKDSTNSKYSLKTLESNKLSNH